MAFLLTVPSCLRMAWETLQDTTYYAPNYTEGKFRTIRAGMRVEDVIRLLGDPLEVEEAREYIKWTYGPGSLRVSGDGGLYVNSSSPLNYTIVMTDGTGKITSVSGDFLKTCGDPSSCETLADMEARFGKPLKKFGQPSRKFLVYSGTKVDGSYHVRKIGLDAEDRVNSIVAGFYQD